MAASQPSPGGALALELLLSGALLALGAFFITTRYSQRLHTWVLNDEVFGSGKHLPPAWRPLVTKIAPIFGWMLLFGGVTLLLVAVLS